MTTWPEGHIGVVCAGAITVDLGKIIDRYPLPEELAVIEELTLSTGGPALNMAVDLRQLGACFPIGMIGAIGNDENGELVESRCRRQNIDITEVQKISGATTSFTDAMVERRSGRRTFFLHFGANSLFDASEYPIENSSARILHIGAPGIHALMDAASADGGNGWVSLLRRAQSAGLHTNMELVSLEPELMVKIARPCLPWLNSVIINELEASSLLGVAAPQASVDGPVDWAALEALATGLVACGVSTLAVVHFPAGCVAAAPGCKPWRQGSVRLADDDICSSTGAGDAFAAGVIYGIHESWPVPDCLRLGSASAAASLRSMSTNDGILEAQACLDWAAQVGYRSVAE